SSHAVAGTSGNCTSVSSLNSTPRLLNRSRMIASLRAGPITIILMTLLVYWLRIDLLGDCRLGRSKVTDNKHVLVVDREKDFFPCQHDNRVLLLLCGGFGEFQNQRSEFEQGGGHGPVTERELTGRHRSGFDNRNTADGHHTIFQTFNIQIVL